MAPQRLTRRQLLVRLAPGLALAALLSACGQPTGSAATAPAAQGTIPRSATPGPGTAYPPSPSATSIAASPTTLSAPTPTLSAAAPVYLGDAGCATGYRPDLKPDDPYQFHQAGEGAAIPFAEKVRRYGQLIILGTVRDILPARWATPDGRRPTNPHGDGGLLIITPVRVQVERVAKGDYGLADIYLAAPGGRIGADCASYSGSGARPRFVFGERTLYFLAPFDATLPGPVVSDSRYRYVRPDFSYTVKPEGTITIGPESDIMGHRADDPPRTLTVDETLREIAAILAAPSTTPTR
jgi:hypothetical protein